MPVLLSALSAESKKESNPLRSLFLCGDYKSSNCNRIAYLRIRVMSHGGGLQAVEAFFLRSLKRDPVPVGGQGLKVKIIMITRFGLDLRFLID
jgi:hypothetical protein